MSRIGLALLLIGFQGSALSQALSTEKLYETLSPAVFFVWGFDADGRRIVQGSGVLVAPGKVVAGCQQLDKAQQIYVQREESIHLARLEVADLERDLCQLAVRNLTARPVAIGSARDLRVGQKVYVLANARGLEGAFGEGMVSSRPDGGGAPLQATASIAAGTSGVGVFNAEGRLVAITTSKEGAQGNLNLAAPAEWVGEIGPRAKAAEDRKQAAAAASIAARTVGGIVLAPGVPVPGAVFTYRYSDKAFGGRQATLKVSVAGVDGTVVRETVLMEGQAGSVFTAIPANEARFVERMLPDGVQLSEFAPYALAISNVEKGNWLNIPGMTTDARPWRISARAMGWENVTVPAGTFKALKVRVSGNRDADLSRDPRLGVHEGREFEYSAWYAEETKRAVKIEKLMRATSRIAVANETIELMKYEPR